MIFKDFHKNTFVSGLSVAIILMCFSPTPSLAGGNREIALSQGAISFTCVPFKKAIKKRHVNEIIKKIEKANGRGNTISEIIIKDCFISGDTLTSAREALNRKCGTKDKNSAIEIKVKNSQEFSAFLADWHRTIISFTDEILRVD